MISIKQIRAGGTPSGTTYLRGDGSWATPSGGGSSGTAPLIAKVSNYSVISGDSGSQFIGNYTFTLPTGVAIPGDGNIMRFGFMGTCTIQMAAGDTALFGWLVGTVGSTVTLPNSGTSCWLANTAANTWVVERQSGSPPTIN